MMLRTFRHNVKEASFCVSKFSTTEKPTSRMMPKDYYSILKVKPTASQYEIKMAYLELSKKFHPDACRENTAYASQFVDIAEAFSVLGKSELRREYDAKRKLTALGLFGDGFRMYYPAPHADLNVEVLNAYDEEMRRRWHIRLEEWARGQGAYELERGVTMDQVTTIFPSVSNSRLTDTETRWYIFLACFASVLTASYLYYLIHH